MSTHIHYSHPAEYELLAYAEGLVGQVADLNPQTVQHIQSCSFCTEIVAEMKSSMILLDHAGSVEPSRELAASIEMASQKLRREIRTKQTRGGVWVQGKRLAVAAMVLLMAGVLLNFDRIRPLPALPRHEVQAVQVPRNAELFSLESLARLTREEEVLMPAVFSMFRQPQSDWERSKLRELKTYEDDISEAMQALKHNPALVRAGHLIQQNRQLKGQTLKDVYVERD
jgi:hypothetical protein